MRYRQQYFLQLVGNLQCYDIIVLVSIVNPYSIVIQRIFMAKVSVIIPSRNEQFLPQTVNDLLTKATGDIEVIAVLDGYWPEPILPDDPRLILLHHGIAKGMRASIMHAYGIARGEYLMKCDAHCLFGEGYDEILQADCEPNWIVIPRRYSLDAEKWECKNKEPVDYGYIFYPYEHPDDLGLHMRPWYQKGRERKDILLDEDLSFQGSCWFTARKFFEQIGGVDEYGYETFMGEPQEIGFKAQLGPWEGKVMRNKKTYYAHLHKGKQYGRGYYLSSDERRRGNAYSFDHWWNNRWTERAHDIEWLIDQFMPMPGWPANWKEKKNG